jgi:hypothetical protein
MQPENKDGCSVAPDEARAILIRENLNSAGISSLSDLDVLSFIYRHRASLGSADQIARLLGYPREAVGNSLGTLEARGLIRRSRASQDVHLYQFLCFETDNPRHESVLQLMRLAGDRAGRLLIVNQLRQFTEEV